ncbi:hypothetical protein LTR28_008323 [Elasticomyces elasticus]|nr:hypothetical protein LTR28_008323 [Elasticomyces elasticus]
MSSATTSGSTRLHEESEHAAADEAKPKEPVMANQMHQVMLDMRATLAQMQQIDQEMTEIVEQGAYSADEVKPKGPVMADLVEQASLGLQAATAQSRQKAEAVMQKADALESFLGAADGANSKEPVIADRVEQAKSELQAAMRDCVAQSEQTQQAAAEFRAHSEKLLVGLRKAQAKFRSKAEEQAAYRELGAMME